MSEPAKTMRQYPLRMATELFAIAERLAEAEQRTLNMQLTQLIREAYIARGELPKPKKPTPRTPP